MDANDTVLRFIQESTWQDFPDDVRHQAKRCLLDALGALLAGTATPAGRLMAQIARSQHKGNEATILVHGSRVSASGAALANGFAANALDIDDGHRMVKGHPGACVLPALLAAAEIVPVCRGVDFLAALVVGYEVGIRAGRIRHATYECYHSSGSWGAIAGAAAAGKILGLETSCLRNAMGSAEYHAPIAPMMKGIATPCMGKDSIGWGALVATMSVLMAQGGFTGIAPLFTDTPDPEWIDALGTDWQIRRLYFKPYAACRWAQPAVEGALKIQRAQNLSPRAIHSICIRTFEAACALSVKPPGNTEEAQYNIAFPVAAALVDGEVGPDQVLPPRIFDPQIIEVLTKIHTEVDAGYESVFPSKTYAKVTVETRDGKQYTSARMEPRWEAPDRLPTDTELKAKFQRLAAPILGDARAEAIVQRIWRLESETDMNALIHACCRPPGHNETQKSI
jgi:2-methylcitrate dehydratase PrpD